MMIDSKRLKDLEEFETRLEALEAAGVDNWCGYGEAMEFLDPR
jgi:hypothetical protein